MNFKAPEKHTKQTIEAILGAFPKVLADDVRTVMDIVPTSICDPHFHNDIPTYSVMT